MAANARTDLATVRFRLPSSFVRAHRHHRVALRVDVRNPVGFPRTGEHAWRVRVRLP